MTPKQLNHRGTTLLASAVIVSLALIAGCQGSEPSSSSPPATAATSAPGGPASAQVGSAPQNQPNSPLIQAATKGDTATVQSLLKDKSTKVDEPDTHGNTALLKAAGDDDRALGGNRSQAKVTETVRLLLSRHANPNATSEDGTTPLFAAIAHHQPISGPIDMPGIADARLWKAQLLIAAGANVNAHTKMETADHLTPGATPLMAAAQQQEADPRMTELLLAHGADVNTTDSEGNTALMRAVRFRNPQLVKILIEHHANVNAKSSTGDTALMEARKSKSRPFQECADLLTKAGETE
jgi:ankyrin repeat protein